MPFVRVSCTMCLLDLVDGSGIYQSGLRHRYRPPPFIVAVTDLLLFAYQTVSVVFDTGSSTLEFASTLCGTACANQVQFDSSKSSTFVDKKTTRYAPRMSC